MENTHTQKVEGGQKILPSLLEKKILERVDRGSRGETGQGSRMEQVGSERLDQASRGHFACPLEIYPSKGEKIT